MPGGFMVVWKREGRMLGYLRCYWLGVGRFWLSAHAVTMSPRAMKQLAEGGVL